MVSDEKPLVWQGIAERRIENILNRHVVARMRTLEQKICDAGPNNQRPEPHHLNNAMQIMIANKKVNIYCPDGDPWYFLPGTSDYLFKERFDLQYTIVEKFKKRDVGKRIGQCLEIAIFKALQRQNKLGFHGDFPDLLHPNNKGFYDKEDPPSHLSSRRISGKGRLDFTIMFGSENAALEAKNIRKWLYPNTEQIRTLIRKATELDFIPVMIARRIPYITFRLLQKCGCVFHQTYNQLVDERDRAVAEKAKDKNLLGYHDIRIGSEPDKRLLKFIGSNLPVVLPKAREKFDIHKDLLAAFATGEIHYSEFVARLRVDFEER